MKLTSAGANKLLRKLTDEKNYLIKQERQNCTYIATDAEEPVIPAYDYEQVSNDIKSIDDKIVAIKHALNVVNTTNTVNVNGAEMTIDTVLVRMAQANARKATLDTMRGYQPKSRLNSRMINGSSTPEYQYTNFKTEDVRAAYKAIDADIMAMQLALDKFNQTFEFDVDIEL